LGETWEEPAPTQLPNPNSGIDLIRTQSGRLLLAYNPSANERTPLALAAADQDENWQPPYVVEDGTGEFSYPTLSQTPDGLNHMVYTWRRQTISHVSFTENGLG
jgi:predicted neuraminidase